MYPLNVVSFDGRGVVELVEHFGAVIETMFEYRTPDAKYVFTWYWYEDPFVTLLSTKPAVNCLLDWLVHRDDPYMFLKTEYLVAPTGRDQVSVICGTPETQLLVGLWRLAVGSVAAVVNTGVRAIPKRAAIAMRKYFMNLLLVSKP
jgi:hypothetical protein